MIESRRPSPFMRLPRAALAAALLFAAAGAAQALPSFSEVREGHRSSETELLSREGEVLQRQRTDASVRRGDWVALADISPALRTLASVRWRCSTDRKSTRLNSSHQIISYAVFCLKKKQHVYLEIS